MSHRPLNPGDRVLFKGEYAGKWATVHEGPAGLNVFQFDGESYDRYISVSTLVDLIDRVVPAQSGKDFDVSKIDVDWRVQLNCGAVPKCAAFYDKWITVIEVFKGGFIGEFEGKRIPFNDHPQSFLAALPPEPAKDPFAVGEWVVCSGSDGDMFKGDLLQVSAIHGDDPINWFVGGKWGYRKSHFRPATPEEIAAHLKKAATAQKADKGVYFSAGEWVVCRSDNRIVPECLQVEDRPEHSKNTKYDPSVIFLCGAPYDGNAYRAAAPEEVTAFLAKKLKDTPLFQRTFEQCAKVWRAMDAAEDAKAKPSEPDGKITFTIAGREFFVGQRVYANTIGTAGLGKLIDVPHEVTGCVAMAELVCIREMDGFNQHVIAASCLSEAPLHEWQFADQASHPKYGMVIVISIGREMLVCSSPSDPEIFIYPAELTFIRRTDLGN